MNYNWCLQKFHHENATLSTSKLSQCMVQEGCFFDTTLIEHTECTMFGYHIFHLSIDRQYVKGAQCTHVHAH